MFKELAKKTRSYRRYDATQQIDRKTLEELIDVARTCASGGNKQPLKYYLSTEKKTNDIIFSQLKWAAMLKEWSGPNESEVPTAYIVILRDESLWNPALAAHDAGISAQTIVLSATEKGLGGCMFMSFNANTLITDLDLPEGVTPLIVIALGKPAETVILEDTDESATAYYRDENDCHHVPKRSLKTVLIN